MVPGVKCSHLYNLGSLEMKKHGYQLSLPIVGHGVGKDVHEIPFLTQYNDSELESGMVITVEIMSIKEDWTVSVDLEDEILVTDKGYRDFNFIDLSL